MKQANPDAYLVGEIWHEAPNWLRGDRFDAVMNYVLARAALGFFGAETLRTDYEPGGFKLKPLSAQEFAQEIDLGMRLYDQEVIQVQLNLMDSHDTARTLWTVDGDESALRLCTLMQMTLPGAPCIYYGDEIGMTGATDPECRAAFPWHDRDGWNHDLLDFFRRAIALRRAHPVLRTGSVQTLYADHGIYACLRAEDDDAAVVVYNTRQSAVQMSLSKFDAWEGKTFRGVWNGKYHTVRQGALHELEIPARDALVLVREDAE